MSNGVHREFQAWRHTVREVKRAPTHSQRLVTARLVHRFNFGPTPGQYTHFLNEGLKATQAAVLTHNVTDPGLATLVAPALADLGQPPASGTAAATAFYAALNEGNLQLVTWWLDRMALAEHPLIERMTWFWHGHWATSLGKVEYPLTMQIQNNTLRSFALGNFGDMAKAMVVDGALIYWLDNENNYLRSPNENLARELMELFTLGVNNYTQADVTAAARALTGYHVTLSNGGVSFSLLQHDQSMLTILGTTGQFNAEGLAALLVSQQQNANFIVNRLWFRFVSSTTAPPSSLVKSFEHRNIPALVSTLVRSPAWSDPVNSLVKSPVEWLVGACRALRVQPSTLPLSQLLTYLGQMGQLPFQPPNVGGWPYDEAWLNGAAQQYRFELAQLIVAKGDLTPLDVPATKIVQAAADWLGVAAWSRRTSVALATSAQSPSQLAIAALCAPEYAVSV